MFPVLQIGPLAMQTPGLILLAGLWIGLTLAERHASRFSVEARHLYNLAFYSLSAALIGARLAYAGQHFSAFWAAPLSLFSLNPGLLDPWGGAAVGWLAGLLYVQRSKLPIRTMLDAITPILAASAIAWGLATLASGDAFGQGTTLPWGIELWGARRHPTQIYSALLALLILWVMLAPAARKVLALRVPGETFVTFLALSAAARLLVEAFRGDSVLLPNGIRVAQGSAWLVLAVCLWGLGRLKKAEYQQAAQDQQPRAG
jgi:prolipoprotein diacylglyceryltransferase